MATEFISNSWLMPTNANAEANRVSNYSLSFDGSNDSIAFASSVDLGLNNSVSMWVNLESGYSGALLGETSYGSTGYFLLPYASGFFVRIGTVNVSVPNVHTYLTANSWHNLTVVRNSGNFLFYVDGTFRETVALSSTTTTKFDIIGNSGTGADPIEGKITEVSAYDYALSASQVTELYGTGSAIGNPMAITNGRKPVAYYPLGNAAFNSEFLVPNSAEQDFVFDFDGTNDYINCGNDSSLNITNNITISAWIKADLFGTYNLIIGKSTNKDYDFGTASIGGNNVIRFHTGDGTQEYVDSSGISLVTGLWYQVAIVRTTTPNQVTFFVNGEQLNTVSLTRTPIGSTDITRIGSRSGSFSFDGSISNVSIFDLALPATGTESVESLYNYGTPPNIASYSNLQAWWELDASATFDGNWSIPDASGNSNTGTSSGMTAANLILSDLIINQSYDPFSLSFDGSDDNVNCGDFSAYDNGDLSCSIWIFRTTSVSNDYIISNTNSSNVAGLDIIIDSTERLMLRRNTRTKDCKSGWTTSGITLNNWHHIAITYNEASNEGKIYVDKVLKSTIAGSLSTNSASTDLKLGSASIDLAFFTGKLSNCSIYNSTLSEAQVTTLYNEHKPFDLNTFEVTPVSWWRLGSVNSSYNSTSSEWTILDEIGTNNGTGSNLGPAQTALSDGVGATGSGLSSGMSSGTNRTGDAPYSSSNAVSYNMSVTAKSTSVPT